MPTRTFLVDELEEMEVGYANEYKETRSRSRWSETFDIVFRADDEKLYHVVYEEGLTEYQDYTGVQRYPFCNYSERTVTCHEVEIYEELRPVTMFRKVTEPVYDPGTGEEVK